MGGTKMKRETKSVTSVFVVLAGYVLSITAFTTGGTLASGLSFKEGIFAIFTGNMVLALYSGLLGLICWKANNSSSEMYKPVFGKKGSVLAISLVGLFVAFFMAVYCALIGTMTPVIFRAPAYTGIVAIVLYLVIAHVINVTGFKGISAFGKLALPALALFVIFGLIMIQREVGFSNVTTYVPAEKMPVFSAVSLVAASWMVGATVSSDMTRYVKKPAYVFLVTIAAFLCVTVLESTGMFIGMATGEANIVTSLSALGLILPAYAIYLLLSMTSGVPGLMIVGNNLVNMLSVFPKMEQKIKEGKIKPTSFSIPVCIFSGIVGFWLMSNNFTGRFIAIINIIGSAIPPVGGVFAAHYLFGKGNKDVSKAGDYNVPAFIAWIVGIFVANAVKWGIVALNGFVAAGLVYLLVEAVMKNKSQA